MSGHRHNSGSDTQNQGNTLGDKACVRQSKLYRQHESGNSIKGILGKDSLMWETDVQEGAYKGKKVFDHNAPNSVGNGGDDPRYAAQDMKNKFSATYQRPDKEAEYSAPTRNKYQEPDNARSLTNYQTKNKPPVKPVYQSEENQFRNERNRHEVPAASTTDYRSLRNVSTEPQRGGLSGRGYDHEDDYGGGNSVGGSSGYRQPPVDRLTIPERNPYRDASNNNSEYGNGGQSNGRDAGRGGGRDPRGGREEDGDRLQGSKKKPENYYVSDNTVYGKTSNPDASKGDKSTRPW